MKVTNPLDLYLCKPHWSGITHEPCYIQYKVHQKKSPWKRTDLPLWRNKNLDPVPSLHVYSSLIITEVILCLQSALPLELSISACIKTMFLRGLGEYHEKHVPCSGRQALHWHTEHRYMNQVTPSGICSMEDFFLVCTNAPAYYNKLFKNQDSNATAIYKAMPQSGGFESLSHQQ